MAALLLGDGALPIGVVPVALLIRMSVPHLLVAPAGLLLAAPRLRVAAVAFFLLAAHGLLAPATLLLLAPHGFVLTVALLLLATHALLAAAALLLPAVVLCEGRGRAGQGDASPQDREEGAAIQKAFHDRTSYVVAGR
ncbi:hypothetical protein EJV46_06405 [Roseococcus sp. SYP-B2431]|uniref:hypothetical protein n=1 Tax=Roseococcus sp. SYP-B2431 TaxID=2496640 RepID=UPI001038A47A|nr:hypothetical protein [Roseococcus sp. SYP-B2431]TCI00265.1 hypothetical protein EJV46_06405 [Roseococcus sp. SYP-B2431]